MFKVGSLDDSKRPSRIRAGLATVSNLLGTTPDVAAVAWLLRHPAPIIPILGTMNVEHLQSQAKAFEVAANMTVQQWYLIADAAGIPIN